MPIWRLQVRFVTANVGDAGTDDGVKVELNGANRTWLDSGRDDHERGTVETFDLRSEGIQTLSDLDYLRIEKEGSDGWAIRGMQLLVNGVVIYDEQFPAGPLWLDNEGGHARFYVIDDSFMRTTSAWTNYAVPVRSNVVPAKDMERRLEALTGDFLHDAGEVNFIGGDHGAELFAYATNTWRVDLDLEDEKQFPFPDLEFDVDFDLTVSCAAGRPNFTTANVNVDASWPEWDHGAGDFVSDAMGPLLSEMMKNYRFIPACPSIVLAPNADLHFNPAFPPFGEFPDALLLDSAAPIGLHVSTGGETALGVKSSFVATAKSTLKQDEKVEVSFELPPQVLLTDGDIVAQAGKRSYKVGAKVEALADGSTRVAFNDSLPAASLVHYTLPYQVKSSGETTGAIKTVIQPLDEKTASLITALTATTAFAFTDKLTRPGVTRIVHAQYVADLPKGLPATK
jgi:hypothetical protein